MGRFDNTPDHERSAEGGSPAADPTADRHDPAGPTGDRIGDDFIPDVTTADQVTVLHERSLQDLDLLQADVVSADIRAADLFLRFVRETSALVSDEERLLDVMAEFTFRAFRQASHCVVVVAEPETHALTPMLVCSRDGAVPAVALSRTLVHRVMGNGVSLLYTQGQGGSDASESIRLSRIRTAICAPLSNRQHTFGVIQLDIRHPAQGSFGRKDVDRLALFAHHVALVLDNLRLYREQREALDSTIDALVHSLSLKDPDTAEHSLRVKALALYLGRCKGLSGSELDALGVAAVLHDMGKHGVRNDVLNKPARLTDDERREMSKHSGMTQNILDRIRYPAHLKMVPLLAAYHHEKMNGSGPYGLAGAQIPVEARIISVADVFDALVSARAYKKPMSASRALAILAEGAGQEWDPEIIALVRANVDDIVATLYPGTPWHVDPESGGEARAA